MEQRNAAVVILALWAGLLALSVPIAATAAWLTTAALACLFFFWMTSAPVVARVGAARTDLIASTVICAPWGFSPIMVWALGDASGHITAVLMVAAAYTLVLLKFGARPRAALVVSGSVSVSAVFLCVADAMVTGRATLAAAFFVYFFAIAVFITVAYSMRRRMERSQRERARLLDQLQMAIEVGGACVYEVDLARMRIIGGESTTKIYGRQLTFFDLQPERADGFLEEDREFIKTAFRDVLRGERQNYEHRFYRPDGRIGWVRLSHRILKQVEGRTTRLLVMATDITDRKERETALMEAIARCEGVLEARRQLLSQLTETLGIELETSSPDACAAAATQEAASGPCYEELEARMARLMGEIRLRDEALREAVERLTDARDRAEAANVAKSQFLATMSHELRTPLNAIIGYSEIMREEAVDADRDGDVADHDRVLSAARHLLSLINDVLDLSKIEAGRMEAEVSDVDVAALVAGAVDAVMPQASARGNTVTVEIAPGVGVARTDEMKTRQCLLNLLSNAAKFTADGAIAVTVERKGGALNFMVRDTGIGIATEKMATLFDPFVQADASTTRVFGGTGLGLAITRKMAQLLGGDVTAESVVGEGSAFTLTISADLSGNAGDAAPELVGDGPAVLIIDDDAGARDLTSRALSRAGFATCAASDAATGLARLRALRPALLVLDINLPDQSGWDVLAEIAGEPDLSPIPRIVVSVEDDRARAIGLGACDHLVKPVDREVLIAHALRFARLPAAPAEARAAPAAKATG